MSTTTLDRLRTKAKHLTEEERREAAAKEARRRWEEIRSSLAATADQWAGAAEEQWEHARDAAAPRVEHLRGEVGDLTGDLRRSVVGLGRDVRDASRAEADRIIQTIQQTAAEAREAERKRRVRALVGWTAFGMAAGAFLVRQLGDRGAPHDDAARNGGAGADPTLDPTLDPDPDREDLDREAPELGASVRPQDGAGPVA